MRTTLAIAVVTLACWASRANAVLMTLGTNELDYRALGASMAGKLLSLRISNNVGPRDTSATYLNEYYGLTVAHNFTTFIGLSNPETTIEVGSGPNFYTDRGTVVAVESVFIYPGYDGTSNTPDIAIIRFGTPLAGPLVHLGIAALDDMVTAAGFGRTGYPGETLPSQDGWSRGWQARVGSVSEIGVNPDYYNPAPFGSYTWGLTLNGRGASGDSGGPTFNEGGELVGITASGSGGTSTLGNTNFLDLSNPEVHAWILANTVLPDAPPGDFNGDLKVDAADYVVWRKSSSSTVDYNLWRTHFGESYVMGNSTSFAAVPEPHVLVLVVTVAMGFARRRVRS